MKIIAESQEECPVCKNFSVTATPKYRRVFLTKEFSHIELKCQLCDWKQSKNTKSFLEKIFNL